MDDSKIIKPGNNGIDRIISSREQRATLVDLNRRLVREIEIRNRIIKQQGDNINAMNNVLTKISETIGTRVPQSAAEGVIALEEMMKRLKEMVEDNKNSLNSLSGSNGLSG